MRLEDASLEIRHDVAVMMGDVLMLQGDYEETGRWLDRASETARTETQHAKVSLLRGELSFKRGDKDQAVTHFEASLRRLGQPICSNRFWLFCGLAVELTKQARNSLFPSLSGARDELPSDTTEMVLSLYSKIAHAYWYTRDKYYTLWAHLRGMNAAECYAPTGFLGQSYSEHAPVMTLLRWKSRGITYATRSLRIRESLNDVWGQGQTRNFLSILLYSFSDFQKCIHQSRQAVEILERTGDYWEFHIAQYQLAASLFRTGATNEAIEACEQTYASAIKHGDYQATGNIIAVWSRAAFGNVPEHIIRDERDRNVYDPQRSCQVRLACGVADFYHRRFESAVSHFRGAIEIAETAGVTNTYVSPSYPWLCTALRNQNETQPARTVAVHKQRSEELIEAAEKAVAVGKRFTNELPHALRELAAAHAASGKARVANKLFRRSIEVASQQNASLERAQSIVLQAAFATELGWETDESELEDASTAIARAHFAGKNESDAQTISLIDRFDSLLASGRKISVSVQPSAIYQEVRDAAKRILRAEHVFIVIPDANGDFETIPEHQHVDPDLIRQAQSSRATVVRDQEGYSQGGVATRRDGTFLCSPIEVGEETTAYLYLTNKRFSGVYGEDEIRIADYLTSAAGAALEKADGFQKLQELNATLEKKVEQRTASVVEHSKQLQKTADELLATQSKLRGAKDAAEAANRAKSDFLARMSHEIRTPITGILGFAELLLRGVVTAEQQRIEHVGTIHSNGTHLLHLLNDILDISKIEADQVKIEQIECVPARMLGDVVNSLRSKAVEKGIELNMAIPNPIPETIVSDPTRLRQILTNLIGNAIKFTESGNVNVCLNSIGRPEAPDQLELIVEDTGIGMTREQMSKVFDPFTQADSSTTRRFGGTGLGLSISKRLAEALGGRLEVASEVGVGTRFTMTFRATCPEGVRVLDAEEAIRCATSVRRGEFNRVDLSGVRVLVVDDGETNRDLIRLLLADAGATILTANDGAQAVDALIHQRVDVDVVLMDMQMPVMDGYQATVELRNVGYDKPIIALTANAMVGDERRCRESGCTEYLTKPLNLNALLDRVGALSQRAEDGNDMGMNQTPKTPKSNSSTSPPEWVSPRETESETSILPDDWLREFASDFVVRVSDHLPQMIQACESGDLDEVGRQAHWIKGTGGTVGLDRLTELAIGCERAVEDTNVDEVYASLKEIKEYLEAAKLEMSSVDGGIGSND